MIEHVTGNILDADCEALVNPVNCVGVMGRGLALQFRNAYTENYVRYKEACRQGKVQPGRLFVHATGLLINPKYIINFPTKRHYRHRSLMAYIESGLRALHITILGYNIKSIAIPPLGCGLGGLNWREVRALIVKELEPLTEVVIKIYEPR